MKTFSSKQITELIPKDCGWPKHNLIIEVGAHNGSDTLNFANLLNGYEILAFEPDPNVYKKLRATMSRSLASREVNAAVSNFNGRTDFYLSKYNTMFAQDWDFSGSIMLPKNHLNVYPQVSFSSDAVKVVVTRLDSYLDQHIECEDHIDEISFIWIDAQGAEKQIIEGLGDYLGITRYIYTEYSDKELYAGQASKAELMQLMPCFDLLLDDGDNILLKNRNL